MIRNDIDRSRPVEVEQTNLMALPRYFALKTRFNTAYLRCLSDEGGTNGFLQFSGNLLSLSTKYEVENAKSDKGLVHLRSCYNDKYWGRNNENDRWIVAMADEPDEDKSKWSCTLFEPVFVDAETVRFRHVQLGLFACLLEVQPPPFSVCFYLKEATPGLLDMCTIIDMDYSLMVLPKHVAFKDDNGNYLATTKINGHQYLQFKSSNDIGDPIVWNEIFTHSDGSIHIKSHQVDKFWSANPEWIWADTADFATNETQMLFWPIKVENNVIALRSLVNNQFCKRLTVVGIENCLNAQAPTITSYTHIQVEELVLSRNIYNVDFRISDARICGETVVTIAKGNANNRTQDSKTIELKLSYIETRDSTWSSNVSVKLIDKNTLQSGVPVIDKGKIKISDEFNGAYQWGKIESSENVVETVYVIALPPMTMVMVNLLATKGSCDIPFSYSQRDVLLNGVHNIYDMEDGVYTGSNFFNFKFESKQEPLLV